MAGKVITNKKVVFVVGPTAVGKTHYGICIARRFGGEVVSADSMQIYKGFEIGTGAATKDEMGHIKHHMIGNIDPLEQYSVAQYQKDAKTIIKSLLSRKTLPVVVGGTGLYINSLTHDLDFSSPGGTPEIRQKLSAEYDKLGAQYMYEQLTKLNPAVAKNVHPNDKRRVIRNLEVIRSREKRITHNFNRFNPDYECIIVGLMLERATLKKRISLRVDQMIEEGLEEEVLGLVKKYGPNEPCFQAIGYKEFIPYFLGQQYLDTTIAQIKQRTAQYAKRQMTWFKRDNRIKWFNVANRYALQDAIAYVKSRFITSL